MSTVDTPPRYLAPYLTASQKYGAGFGALLWASPRRQAVRFQALLQLVDVTGLTVMDVGCGRADLFEYMLNTHRYPKAYIGMEAVETLAKAAEKKSLPNCRILHGDFVQTPQLLHTDADVLVYSGSLNTMDALMFYANVKSGFEAARHAIVFNFLCSPVLAGASHLTWHCMDDVMRFGRSISRRIKVSNNYMRGDATVALFKD